MARIGSSTLFTAALLATIVAACAASAAPASPGASPRVDVTRATAIATNALDGYNAGDYARYSRDWSDAMKAAIKERDFQAFRANAMTILGRWVRIESVTTTTRTPGTVRYEFLVAFEKRTATFSLVFRLDGEQVEGSHVS